LIKQLRRSFPKLRVVVGLWNFSDGGEQADERLAAAFSVEVVTTLAQVMEQIRMPAESINLPEALNLKSSPWRRLQRRPQLLERSHS
jgi:hypothetical protein